MSPIPTLAVLLVLCLVACVARVQGQNGDVPRERLRVSVVDFEGNETYEDLVLRNVIATEQPSFFQRLRMKRKQRWFFDEEEIRRDVIRVERFYRRRGFVEPRISYRIDQGRRSWQRKVIFQITEGPFFRLESLDLAWEADSSTIGRIMDTNEFRRAMRRIPLREGRRYEPILETETAGEVNAAVRNASHAFSTTQMETEIDSVGLTVNAVLRISPGPAGSIDSLIVEGNTTAREDLLLREAGLEHGESFSQRKLDEAQKQLYAHPLIRFVTVGLPEQPEDSSVTVRVRLRENPLRQVEVLAGVGNRELVRTQVTWTHRNAFGRLHSFGTTARVTYISQRASVDYLIPYALNTYSSVLISPFLERREERAYLLRRGGIKNSFIYQYGNRLTTNLAYTFSGNKVDVYNTDATLPDDVEQYTISAIELSALYAEQFFAQERGWVLRPSLELSGFFQTGDYVYQKLYLDARRYIPVTRSFKVALRGVGGMLFGAKQDSLPPNILYYAGGFGSVRGWYENQLGPKRPLFNSEGGFERYVPEGGRYQFLVSAETRVSLGWVIPNLGFSTFVDGGQIWQRWPGFGNSERSSIQYGIGGGLYYDTPVGPVRFDVAWKVNPTPEDLNILNGADFGRPIDRWGFHFSLGQSF